MGGELSPTAKNIVGYAETISKTLAFGGVVCVTAITARALGSDEIKAGPVSLPVGYTTLVIGLGTLAHVFWSFHIMTALREFSIAQEKLAEENFLLKHPDRTTVYSSDVLDYGDATQQLFDEIRTQKGLFLRGLVPRALRQGSRVARMSWYDPTTWLSYGFALLTIVAILPWRYDNGAHWASPRVVVSYATIALMLVIVNWYAGGLWIIALSRLTEDASANRSNLFSARKLLKYLVTTLAIIAAIIAAMMMIHSTWVAVLGVIAVVTVVLVSFVAFNFQGSA